MDFEQKVTSIASSIHLQHCDILYKRRQSNFPVLTLGEWTWHIILMSLNGDVLGNLNITSTGLIAEKITKSTHGEI